MADQRIYEVVFIVDPDTGEDEVTRLSENLQQIVADRGGAVTKSENMGRRQLAYRIGRKNEGVYMFFEIEGSGREIAELERRMRVSDQVIRYITVRVDEDRAAREVQTAERASEQATKTPGAAAQRGGGRPHRKHRSRYNEGRRRSRRPSARRLVGAAAEALMHTLVRKRIRKICRETLTSDAS